MATTTGSLNVDLVDSSALNESRGIIDDQIRKVENAFIINPPAKAASVDVGMISASGDELIKQVLINNSDQIQFAVTSDIKKLDLNPTVKYEPALIFIPGDIKTNIRKVLLHANHSQAAVDLCMSGQYTGTAADLAFVSNAVTNGELKRSAILSKFGDYYSQDEPTV